MLTKSKDYLKIKKKIKNILNDTILDVFLFGSFVRGKEQPGDIDLCVVFRNEVDVKVIKSIKKGLELNTHISMLTADNFFQKLHSLAPTILFEGISLVDDKFIAEKYGLKQMFLFKYDISAMNQSKKTRFVRLLRGKNNLVQKLHGEFVSPGVFLLPLETEGSIIEFLEYWDVNYTKKKVMMFL